MLQEYVTTHWRTLITDAREDAYDTPSKLRVPLDIIRSAVPRSPWRPFMLSDSQVSGQPGLLTELKYIRDSLLSHTGTQVALVLDENIWHRLMRCMNGKGWVGWSTRWGPPASLQHGAGNLPVVGHPVAVAQGLQAPPGAAGMTSSPDPGHPPPQT